MKIARILPRLLTPLFRYDEWRYWNARAVPNAPAGWDDEIVRRDVAYITEHTHNCRRILEIGAGVGRTLHAYTPESQITCYDITPNYRKRLLARADELALPVNVDIARGPNEPLPYSDDIFDAVVASQVLQHQRPERVAGVMAEMIRVASKGVVIASHGPPVRRTRATHSFHHDYPDICARIGCEMGDVRLWEGRIYFVYRAL